MNTGGVEEGVGEMYGGNNMEIYSTLCKIDSQWKFGVWLKELKQGLCDNLEGWDGTGDEREFQRGGVLGLPMADSSLCMIENHKIL